MTETDKLKDDLTEQHLLGYLLLGNDVDEIVSRLSSLSSPFAYPKHRLIFEAIESLSEQSLSISCVSVINLLREQGQLETEYYSYVTSLAFTAQDNFVSESQGLEYAEIVINLARCRRIVGVCTGLIREAQTGLATIDSLTEGLSEVFAEYEPKAKSAALNELIPEYVSDLLSGAPVSGRKKPIETRVHELNRKIGGGFYRGDVCVIGGPPSMGKSSFALDLCKYAANFGHHNSVYFAIDERLEAMMQRAVIADSEITQEQLTTRAMNEPQRRSLQKIQTDYSNMKGKIFVVDQSPITTTDIRGHLKKISRHSPVDIVVIDYLTQISDGHRYGSDNERAADKSRQLKMMAKEFDVAMLVLSQLSREYTKRVINPDEGELGIPSQSMLRDSGQIEADANVILFPWRPLEALRKRGISRGNVYYDREYNANLPPIENAYIAIAKNKMGPTDLISCKFNWARMRFFTPDTVHQPEGDTFL